MLFLLRPRQTWMPVARLSPEQEERNRQYREAYASTRTVAPAGSPAGADVPAERDLVARLKDLGALHQSGDLSDEEFAAAKARLLEQSPGPA